MTKPVIVQRTVKGEALTYAEHDANFTNLRDATISLTAGTGGTQVVSDLNGVITLVAGTGISLAGDNTAKTVTITSTSGSNSFSTITVDGTSVVADSTADTLTFNAGAGLSSTVDPVTDSITFNLESNQTIISSINRGASALQLTSSASGATVNFPNGSVIVDTVTGGVDRDVNIYPNGVGNVIISGLSSYEIIKTTVPAGDAFLDATSNVATYANTATVDFANFSGVIIINRQDAGSGNVAMWLVGSGAATKLGDSIGNQSGTITSVSGINGYRWTNNTGGTITVSFAAIKTRNSG